MSHGDDSEPKRPSQKDGSGSTGDIARSHPTPSLVRGERSAQPAFADGTTIAGRYRIVRYIARGGMGEVYEAEDSALGGRVALKTIRPEIAEDEKALERFKREIQLARRVTHPNVSRIYDLGVHAEPSPEGTQRMHFLTMELLGGQTLSQRLAAGRLAPAEALPIAEQVAAGLDAAHGMGVIHRDFKSSNVMLVPSADPRRPLRAVITDFGLARPAAHDAGLASISEAGAVVGTPAYMAPEQVQGLPLTHAADLYALGVVLYEMVTGVRPFEGESAITVAVRRLTEAPARPTAHVPELDPAWEAVILRCLEREPGARLQSGHEIVAALRGGVLPAPPPLVSDVAPTVAALEVPGALPRRRALLLALPVLAVLGLALGILLSGRWPWRASAPAPSASPAASAAPSLRKSVAVLGFRNTATRREAAWLGTALAEMVATDLGAGGRLRLVSGAEVARLRSQSGMDERSESDPAALSRLGENLGADLLVVGSYASLEGRIRIDARLLDAASGELLASGQASGPEDQLFELVARVGGPLRQRLGLGALSASESQGFQASFPVTGGAARPYAEGLARLAAHDALGAREAFEKAAAADPKHPLPQAMLAGVLSTLGYEVEARQAARTAVGLAGSLSKQEKLLVEARLHEVAKEWDAAAAAYTALHDLFPDDTDLGVSYALVQIARGRSREALVILDALRRLPPPASEDPRIDVAEARAWQDLGDRRKHQALAARAAEKALSKGARELAAFARTLEAQALRELGEPDKAMAAIEEARRLYDAVGDRGGLALALNMMALMLHDAGDLEGALRIYQRALAIQARIGFRKGVARAQHNIGMVFYDQGRSREAVKQFQLALATCREIGDKYGAAQALIDLGAQLQVAGDTAAAEQRYQEALALYSELGEKTGIATALTNLAEIFYGRGELTQAQGLHEESLAANREIGDKSGMAYDQTRLGMVFTAKGDLLAARDRYAQALALQEELGEKSSQEQTRLALAGLDLLEAKPAPAEAQARRAEEVLRAAGAEVQAAHAQLVVAEALLLQGKAGEAREALSGVEPLVAGSQDLLLQVRTAIVKARVAAASPGTREAAAAFRSLEAAATRAARAGLLEQAFEARLALGEIEIASGREQAGRGRLAALAAEAKAKGFGLIASRAARA